MKPKEKAEELVERFRMNVLDWEGCSINGHKAKQCALIAADEVLFALKYNLDGATSGSVKYWTEVKVEIKNL